MEMNGCSEKDEDCPQLLDLISKDSKWNGNGNVSGKNLNPEDNKLELRLGLPGEDDWSGEVSVRRDGFFPLSQKFSASSNFLRNIKPTNLSAFRLDLQNTEKKPFSPSSANPAVANSSQKRTAPAPVVGWPPIRSSRRNVASTSFSKPTTEPADAAGAGEKSGEVCGRKGLFVKINMDGVPIGRKVDLNAYDSYQKLSSAVDELFRGLLAAQRDSLGCGVVKKQEEEKPITGLLDGSGEYTLVYEDNEGDRVLVGDVPWQMFISTVKRLRVLKSSELPAMSICNSKPQKMVLDSATK